jgi:dsRNA-specific ribonuclease
MQLPPHVHEKKETLLDFISTLSVDRHAVKDFDLLMTAFIHKSYAADYAGDFVHNERLEFL